MIDVARLQQRRELVDRTQSTMAAGHHQPDRARRLQLLHELLERRRAGRAFLGERADGVRDRVVDDALVAAAHQAPHHVGAHPAESDHSELHVDSSSLNERAVTAGATFLSPAPSRSPRRACCSPARHVGAEVDAQRAPAALGEHLEVAARLRGLDDAERVLLPRHRQVRAHRRT